MIEQHIRVDNVQAALQSYYRFKQHPIWCKCYATSEGCRCLPTEEIAVNFNFSIGHHFNEPQIGH